MPPPIPLPPRRYTVLDSARIAFRCAPAAAFFYAFFDLASAALVPLVTLVAAALIDAVVRSVQQGAPVREAYVQLALLAALTAFRWLRSSMHNIADLRLVLALRARYRTALTEKTTRLAYGLLEDSDTWDLIQRVAANPEGGRLKATYFHLIDMASFIIKVVGLLLILASAVWWAPLVVLAVAAFALVTGVRGGKTIYRAEQESARHDRRVNYLGEVILGREAAAERTLFGSTHMLIEMWRRAFNAALAVRFRARFKWYINAYAGNLTNILIWTVLMLVLVRPLSTGAVSVGLFIALTQAFTQFDIVWGFMDTVNGLAADAEFFKDLTAFLSLPEEDRLPEGDTPPERDALAERDFLPKKDQPPSEATPAKPPIPLIPEAAPAAIELRDVHFRYPGTDRTILDGLTLILEPGVHYALVGVNGCGKTTVTRLITGLYPPDSGCIRLNGRDLREYSPAELGAHFSIVYQDFARYGLSLYENVYLGSGPNRNGERDNASQSVFERAGLGPLVARLPQGVDTPLSKLVPGGVDISGGEWQRVAMARSLARPSGLRILDEPTAALDPVAESQLYASFETLTGGATTLLITHRLGATKTAEVIMVLDGGRITESGSHTELMRTGGLYSRMYESQRYWYEAD